MYTYTSTHRKCIYIVQDVYNVCTNMAMKETYMSNLQPFWLLPLPSKSTNLITKLSDEWAGLISYLSTLIKLGE